jgi:ketosteroid isomerase-like protein
VSQENVEIVRRAFEGFNRDGPEAVTAFLDPEIEWHDFPSLPDAGVHHGHEGFLAAMEQFLGDFEDFRLVIDEIFAHGNQVIAYYRNVGRGRGSGATFERRQAGVLTLRNGSIVRAEWFGTQAEALKAVGLEEYALSANLDLVRLIYADWERGDFSSARWADPAIRFSIVGGPDPGTWTGQSGMRTGWFRFLEAWEDFQVNAEEYRELDDTRVLVLIRRSGRGRSSQLPVEQMRSLAADVFHILDGKVVQLMHYPDRDRALADLGLEE